MVTDGSSAAAGNQHCPRCRSVTRVQTVVQYLRIGSLVVRTVVVVGMCFLPPPPVLDGAGAEAPVVAEQVQQQ